MNEVARFTATVEALATLPAVAAKAAESLGVGFGEVGSVEVGSGNENANLTTISATNESPERAAEVANAYARATIAFQRKSSQAKVKAKIAVLENKIDELAASEAPGPKISLLQEQLDTLEVEEALQTGETSLVQEATPPSSASKPKTKRNVILGILLGLVLGLSLAALIERLTAASAAIEELEEALRAADHRPDPEEQGFPERARRRRCCRRPRQRPSAPCGRTCAT